MIGFVRNVDFLVRKDRMPAAEGEALIAQAIQIIEQIEAME